MLRPKNVILIDDDLDDHEIFDIALKDADPSATCTYFVSAKEALDKIELLKPAPDYIFLDLNMPGVSGIQFLEIIKKKNAIAGIPVVVYSTSILPLHRQQITTLGAFDYFTKPSSHGELTRILKKIIHQ
ncbi:MAG TPA: response regulator [Ohtaekwangia sp.]